MDIEKTTNAREFLSHALLSISEVGKLMNVRATTLLNKKVTYADLSDINAVKKANEKVQGIVSIAKKNLDNIAEATVVELNELLVSLGLPQCSTNEKVSEKLNDSGSSLVNGDSVAEVVQNGPASSEETTVKNVTTEKEKDNEVVDLPISNETGTEVLTENAPNEIDETTQGEDVDKTANLMDIDAPEIGEPAITSTPPNTSNHTVTSTPAISSDIANGNVNNERDFHNISDVANSDISNGDIKQVDEQNDGKPLLKLVDINKLIDPKIAEANDKDCSIIILSDSEVSSPEKSKNEAREPVNKDLITKELFPADKQVKEVVELKRLPANLDKLIRKHKLRKICDEKGNIVCASNKAINIEEVPVTRARRTRGAKEIAKSKFEAYRKTRVEHVMKKKVAKANSDSDESKEEEELNKSLEAPEFEKFDKTDRKSSLKDIDSPRIKKHVSFASPNVSSDDESEKGDIDKTLTEENKSEKLENDDNKKTAENKSGKKIQKCRPKSKKEPAEISKNSDSKSDDNEKEGTEDERKIHRKTKSERNKKSKLRQSLDSSKDDNGAGSGDSDSSSDDDEKNDDETAQPGADVDMNLNNGSDEKMETDEKLEKENKSSDGDDDKIKNAEKNLEDKKSDDSDIADKEEGDDSKKRKRDSDNALSDQSASDTNEKKKKKTTSIDDDIAKLTDISKIGKKTKKREEKDSDRKGDESKKSSKTADGKSEDENENEMEASDDAETINELIENALKDDEFNNDDNTDMLENTLKNILESSDDNTDTDGSDAEKENGDQSKSGDKKKEKREKKKKDDDDKSSKLKSDPLLTEKLSDSDGEKEKADSSENEGIKKRRKQRSDKGSTKKKRTKQTGVSSSEDEDEKSEKSKDETEKADESDKDSDIDKNAVRDSSDDSDINIKKKTSDKSDSESSENNDKEGDKNNDSDSDSDVIIKKRTRKTKKSDDSENSDQSTDTEKKKRRRRIKKIKGSDDSSASDGDGSESKSPKSRKNIRKMLKTKNLEEATQQAAREEKERKQRIEDRQKLYNSLFDDKLMQESKVDKLVLDFDPDTKEELIAVHKKLVKKLKPHQANGIKFMFDACFESVKQIKKGYGSGCILAHCMGLGKSLQVVALVHTLLMHTKLTKVRCVLVVCPLSTVLNWVNEFKIWLKNINDGEDLNIYEISKYKQNHERTFYLKEWQDEGGVMIMGYDMFRNLSSEKGNRIRKKMKETLQKCLVDPGADLVVCDEGHLLKNEKTSLSQAMTRIKTSRRIVLTGTPVQNNLKEYYCMMQFVKPNLLGKYTEYMNRFVNPITNGQYTDSTPRDIAVMKRRSHVLHKMLDGCVQRRDYNVLAPFLPPKHEYVLFINLTELQIKLYQYYLDNLARKPAADRRNSSFLFPDFQNFQRIWTHPRVMKANSERYERTQAKKLEKDSDSEGSLKDFIDDDSNSDSDSDASGSNESFKSDDSDVNPKKKSAKALAARRTRASRRLGGSDEVMEVSEPEIEPEKIENPTEWWMPLCPEEELDYLKHSGKLVLLFDILKECEAIGDKILVFSQSLYSLDVIEHFLAQIDEKTQNEGDKKSDDEEDQVEDDKLLRHRSSWSLGLDYFRLDGSTSCENRAAWCKSFNRPDNFRARLFLISTRAGGLGINLVAANRVIIFDVSWNPSHDVQSIFRVYRFGQKKPCYIYRFIARGTMEEKVYERQVTKQAISKRVIDEQQIDRHYNSNDLNELYKFEPVPPEPRPTPNLPKDRLFAELLKAHEKLIYHFHEHDSLLENKEEETLNEDERRAAWEEFENEKKAPPPQFGRTATFGTGGTLFGIRTEIVLSLLTIMIKQDNPTLTDDQIKGVIPTMVQRMITASEMGDSSIVNRMKTLMAQTTAQHGLSSAYYQQPNQQIATGYYGNQMTGNRQIPNWMLQQQIRQQQLQQQQQHIMQQQQLMRGNQMINPFSTAQQSVLRSQNANMVPNPMAAANSSKTKRKLPTLQDFVDLDSD